MREKKGERLHCSSCYHGSDWNDVWWLVDRGLDGQGHLTQRKERRNEVRGGWFGA